MLKERGAAEVVPRLASWVKGLDPNDPEYEHHRLEALWTYQAVDVAEPALLAALLDSKDARVRAAATRVVPFWKTRLADPRSLLAERVSDAEPARPARGGPRPGPDRRPAIGGAWRLQRARSSHRHVPRIWPVADGPPACARLDARGPGRPVRFRRPAERLIFALAAVDSPAIVKPLLALLKAGKVPKEQDENVQTLIARLGGPGDLAVVLDLVIDGQAPCPRPRRVSLLNTLVRATRDRKVVPAGDLARIGTLVTARRRRAARSRGAGDRGLERRVASETSSSSWWVRRIQRRGVRAAAIEALVKNGGAEGRRVVETPHRDAVPRRRSRPGSWPPCWKPTPGGRRRGSSPGSAGSRPTSSARPRSCWLAFSSCAGARRFWPRPSTRLAPTLSADLAKLCIRQVRASGRDEPGLIAALEKAGRLKEAQESCRTRK